MDMVRTNANTPSPKLPVVRSCTVAIPLLAALLAGAVPAASSAAPACPGGAADAATQYIVGWDGAPGLRAGDRLHGAPVARVGSDPAVPYVLVDVAPGQAEAFRDGLARNPHARYCEPNLLMHADFVPNDLWFPAQYGPVQANAVTAWDVTLGDTDAAVCVVDSGVRDSHPDLPALSAEYDFVSEDANADDVYGHGTHVAGIAAARIHNGIGMAGMAQVRVYAARVLGSTGSGTWADVADGITWCANTAPRQTIINLSLGGGFSATVDAALNYAVNTKGNLAVASAGNSGPCLNCVGFPGSSAHTIGVSCTAAAHTPCWFTSQGPQVDIAAPGGNVLSTCSPTFPICPALGEACADAAELYCTLSGTSMSAPHVSGAAALVWSRSPTLTNAQVRACLLGSATDLGAPGFDNVYGHGALDARGALDACP